MTPSCKKRHLVVYISNRISSAEPGHDPARPRPNQACHTMIPECPFLLHLKINKICLIFLNGSKLFFGSYWGFLGASYRSMMQGPRVLRGIFLVSAFFYLCDADENAQCTLKTISPATGLCAGQTFNVQVCTGSSSVFTYTQAQLNNWIQQQTSAVSAFSQTSCLSDQTCKSFLPWTSVISIVEKSNFVQYCLFVRY